MKHTPAADGGPYRRKLKARPLHWIRSWLWMFAFTALFVSIADYLLLRSLSSVWHTLFMAAFLATSNEVSFVWQEWKTQPRRLRYWREVVPSGIVIRHYRTGEILLHLPGTELRAEDLRGVCLDGADLRAEKLQGFDLRGVRLRGANLFGAAMNDCNLDGADLASSRMVDVSLRGARLRGADLRGADFCGSGLNAVLTPGRLEGADFFGALYNAATRWPRGFDPGAHGCAYEGDAEQTLPIPASTSSSLPASLPIASGEVSRSRWATATLRVEQRP